jgi:hypothetical protein
VKKDGDAAGAENDFCQEVRCTPICIKNIQIDASLKKNSNGSASTVALFSAVVENSTSTMNLAKRNLSYPSIRLAERSMKRVTRDLARRSDERSNRANWSAKVILILPSGELTWRRS